MTSTTNTTTTTPTTTSSSAGASVGQKVKGAFQTVHGIGESLRGNAMDFVDSATGTEHRGHGAAVRGQQETRVGVDNLESRGGGVGRQPGVAATSTAPVGNVSAPGGAGVGTGTGRAGAV